MSKVYIFDVDGTLTPSRTKMTKTFYKYFKEWAYENDFFLVTGSDLPKTKEQVPRDILERAEGIFCCCGNEYYVPSSFHSQPTTDPGPIFFEKCYSADFHPPKDLIDYLESELEKSSYPKRCGNHIELRKGMLNFSIVGRDCNLKDRKDFYEWDKKFTKRDRVAAEIVKRWPNLDASLGGEISVDIYPKGKDKAQVMKTIRHRFPRAQYIFVADKTYPGGNDYPLAESLRSSKHNAIIEQVDCWEDTLKALKTHQ